MYNLSRIYKLSEKLICFLTICAISFGIIIPVYAVDDMNLNCKSAVLMDFGTGDIIYEQNSHEKLAPASVTKVMTMLLTIEALGIGKINYEDKVTISDQASSKNSKGTMLLLDAGEVRTVKELLYGIAVESANDACIAMAEHISGSEEEFVKLMNKRAKELGAMDSNFVNPNGLYDVNHKTSAYDLALIMQELTKHSEYTEIATTPSYIMSSTNKCAEKRPLWNGNRLIHEGDKYEGCCIRCLKRDHRSL